MRAVLRRILAGMLPAALLAACSGSGGSTPAPRGIDLQIASLGHSPCSLSAGQVLTVNERVRNAGRKAAGACRLGYYLSTDPDIDPGDTLLGERDVPPLAAGASSSASTPLTVPPATAAGTYYLGAIVDDLSQVPESDESNNRRRSTSCFPGGALLVDAAPELLLTAVTHDLCSVEAGQAIGVDDTVQNQGLGAASGFRVGYYLSTDSSIDTTDTFLGSRSVAGLDAGDFSLGATPLTIPLGTAGGMYFVGAVADDLDDVAEGDEADNERLSSSCFPAGALEVTEPPFPGPPGPGETAAEAGRAAAGTYDGSRAPARPQPRRAPSPAQAGAATGALRVRVLGLERLHAARPDARLWLWEPGLTPVRLSADGESLLQPLPAGPAALWIRLEQDGAGGREWRLPVWIEPGRTAVLEFDAGVASGPSRD